MPHRTKATAQSTLNNVKAGLVKWWDDKILDAAIAAINEV